MKFRIKMKFHLIPTMTVIRTETTRKAKVILLPKIKKLVLKKANIKTRNKKLMTDTTMILTIEIP